MFQSTIYCLVLFGTIWWKYIGWFKFYNEKASILYHHSRPIQSCGGETQELGQYDEPNETEDIITFEKYVANVMTYKTIDGGYIVAGGKNSQAWLMKLDKYGEEEWQNTYTLGDFGYSVISPN